MAELYNYKRVLFRTNGVQKNFINKVKLNLGLSWVKLGKVLKLNPRTLTDWHREKFHMSLNTAIQMSKSLKS